ncbi:MAG: hypothetical protein ACI9HE_001751 [Planctomycetota bacterium]|jgi:hypothetical protein
MTSTGRANYKESRGRRRSRGLALLLALGLCVLSFLVGLRMTGPDLDHVQAQAPVTPGPAPDTSELEAMMEELREMLRSQTTLASPSPRRAVEDPEVPIDPELERQLKAIGERLDQLERVDRMLLARRPGTTNTIGAIPIGVPVREYMQTLEKMGSDVCTKTHSMWTTLQVQQAYGQPDKIEQRTDYVEWIYSFPGSEGQLDFHFVNDLCVLAH